MTPEDIKKAQEESIQDLPIYEQDEARRNAQDNLDKLV